MEICPVGSRDMSDDVNQPQVANETMVSLQLECLETLDHLFIERRIISTLTQINVGYFVNDKMGQRVFSAVAEFIDIGFNSFRVTKVLDNSSNEVIRTSQPDAFCLQKTEIFAPPDHLVGTVKEKWAWFGDKFVILNADGSTVMYIRRRFRSYKHFMLLTLDNAAIGRISKEVSRYGYATDFFKNAHYCINFPLDLDVKMKAILLSACIMIDNRYFPIKKIMEPQMGAG